MSVTRKDLRNFPKPVQDAVLQGLKGNPNLSVKMLDGSHARIMTGDRDEIPFQIAANRPAEDALRLLIPWLAERQPATPAKEIAVTAAPVEQNQPEPDKYGFIEVKPGLYECAECGFAKGDRRGLHLHQREKHTRPEQVEVVAEAKKASAQTRSLHNAQKKQVAREALTALAAQFGLEVVERGSIDLNRCAELEAEVSELKAQVAEYKALGEMFKGLIK